MSELNSILVGQHWFPSWKSFIMFLVIVIIAFQWTTAVLGIRQLFMVTCISHYLATQWQTLIGWRMTTPHYWVAHKSSFDKLWRNHPCQLITYTPQNIGYFCHRNKAFPLSSSFQCQRFCTVKIIPKVDQIPNITH